MLILVVYRLLIFILLIYLQGYSDSKDPGNGITNSTLRFTPTMSQDKKLLECRAENSILQNSVISDEARLHILCKLIL